MRIKREPQHFFKACKMIWNIISTEITLYKHIQKWTVRTRLRSHRDAWPIDFELTELARVPNGESAPKQHVFTHQCLSAARCQASEERQGMGFQICRACGRSKSRTTGILLLPQHFDITHQIPRVHKWQQPLRNNIHDSLFSLWQGRRCSF